MKPVLLQQTGRVVAQHRGLARRQEVGLVEDEGHRVVVRRERTEITVVQRRVGILLRLYDPDEEIGELDHPVDLESVRGLDGIEVRQVEEDETLQPVAADPMTSPDLQPVEQRVGAVAAPDGTLDLRGRRTAPTDGGRLASAQRVEEEGLPRPGRPGQRDDGRLDPEPEPCAGLVDHAPAALDGLRLETALRHPDGLGERDEAPVEVEAHEARLTSSIAVCKRATASASGTFPSSSPAKRSASSRRIRSTRSTRSSRARAASARTA